MADFVAAMSRWVPVALALVPLLNWITIVAVAFIAGCELAKWRREIIVLRREVAALRRALTDAGMAAKADR